MKPSAEKAVAKMLTSMERPKRRRLGGFSLAPITLAGGLALMFALLTRIVPPLWDATLPGGLDRADTFVGLPGLVWKLALLCFDRPGRVMLGLGAAAVLGFATSASSRSGRLLVWLAAAAVIAADAGILLVTIRAAMVASGLASIGMPN